MSKYERDYYCPRLLPVIESLKQIIRSHNKSRAQLLSYQVYFSQLERTYETNNPNQTLELKIKFSDNSHSIIKKYLSVPSFG